MQLLRALSNNAFLKRATRRKSTFLLPETQEEFVRLKAQADALRSQRIAVMFAMAEAYLAQAKTLRREAKLIASIRHENDAEYELARRNARQRKNEAAELRKHGRALMRRARWFVICHWKLPDEVDISQCPPPRSSMGCKQCARSWAWSFENAKIVNKGEEISETLLQAKDHEYWHHKRILLRYQGRFFLATLSKHIHAQPHVPWGIAQVTDDVSQLTEEELRLVANQPM